MKISSPSLRTVVAILVLIASSSAHAATVSWNDGANKWESSSWTGGVGTAPPTSGDDAVIGNGGVVGYDGTTGTNTVLSLKLGSSAAGTLNISGGSLTVTGNITISDNGSGKTGLLNLTGGTLTVGGIIADGGNANSTLTLNGGTLDLTNGSITVDTFNLQSGTLSNLSQFNSGAALVKTTAGTIILSGTNTYTGATTVNGGTLLVNGSTAAGSAVSVNNSGTTLGGTGTINGTVTLASSARLLGGTGASASGSLTLANSVNTSAGIIELALGAAGTHSTLAHTGGTTWTFGATQPFTFIDLGAQTTFYDNIITGLVSDPGTEGAWTITNAGWAGTFTYDGLGDIDLTLTKVPEPGTWTGGSLALAALAFSQRRRLKRLIVIS